MNALSVMPGIGARGGGPANNLFAAVPHLARLGWKTTVFATDAGGPAGAPHRKVTGTGLPAGASEASIRIFPMRPPRRLAYSPAMSTALQGEVGAYDLVRIHSLFLHPHFAAGRASRGANVPYIVSLHGALDPWMRARGRARKLATDALWGHRLLDGAAAIHVATAREAELTSDAAPGVPREIVPNGIDVASFREDASGAAFRMEVLGAHAGPLVVSHGRIAAKKGLDVLIRAMQVVVGEHPDAVLALVGPDDERLQPRLSELARALGIEAALRFTGPLYGTARAAALAAADVWALPSHTENFGSAVVEAAAAGAPIVISPGVNLAPEIEQARAGLVANWDPRETGHAIADLLWDPAARAQLGVRARRFAERYDWTIVAPQMAEMYARVSGKSSPVSQLV